jgi:GTPase Era involved in 16S rRNA processing
MVAARRFVPSLPRSKGPADVTQPTAFPDVTGRVEAIERALAVGGPRLDPAAVAYGRAMIERTGDRLRVGAQYTIVALVGATGSGKSTMFNALTGMDLAETGARRPMTALPMACVWGHDAGQPLLDWLGVPVPNRTLRESVLDADRESGLHGLVLLDMPDHDSTQLAHRLEVNRLVELVDLLVWVVDPQKYADEALHAGYLKRMSGHDGVMIVVLNQVDRLTAEETDTCCADLRRLLDSDGLQSVPLLTTAATTGQGIPELRSMLSDVVDLQAAVVDRVAADLDGAARGLRESVGPGEPDVKDLHGADELVGALAQAAGLPVVLDAVTADYRRQASRAMGWPFARWARRLRPDPLRRLRLGDAEPELRRLTRSALPETTPSQRAHVEAAVRTITTAASDVLPRRWADGVRAAASRPDADLTKALDTAVSSVDLSMRRPPWWTAVNVSQVLLALVALAGAGWLVWLGVARAAGLSVPSSAEASVGPLPVPVLLLSTGLLLGGVVALAVGRAVVIGSRRRRAQVAASMRETVQDVAWAYVMAPVAEVITDHRKVRQALGTDDRTG